MSIDTAAGEEQPGEGRTGEDRTGEGPAGENQAGDQRRQFTCGLCGGSTDDRAGHFLACYPTTENVALARTESDGILALCADCSGAVGELTVAWEVQARPSVLAADSIAACYRARTDCCSFCDDPTGEGPVLGIDSWSPRPEKNDHANFTLCENCVAIFEEFLCGIHSDGN